MTTGGPGTFTVSLRTTQETEGRVKHIVTFIVHESGELNTFIQVHLEVSPEDFERYTINRMFTLEPVPV